MTNKDVDMFKFNFNIKNFGDMLILFTLIDGIVFGLTLPFRDRAYNENLTVIWFTAQAFFLYGANWFANFLMSMRKPKIFIYTYYQKIYWCVISGDIISTVLFITFKNYEQLLAFDAFVSSFYMFINNVLLEIKNHNLSGTEMTQFNMKNQKYSSGLQIIIKIVCMVIAYYVGSSRITEFWMIIIQIVLLIDELVIFNLQYYWIYKPNYPIIKEIIDVLKDSSKDEDILFDINKKGEMIIK